MPAYKYKNRAGKIRWGYQFSLPGSNRKDRKRVIKGGFVTKGEAMDAEAKRRVELQQQRELTKAGSNVTEVPKTLAMLMAEFFRQHVDGKLAPKTVERYHDQATYLDPELLAMPLAEITPLHLSREWERLLKRGGRTRKTKAPRPMSAKTVRNIASVVSSAFARAIKWGLVTKNPVTNSEPPKVKRHLAIALTPANQSMVLEAATGPWCMKTYLEMDAATGCRRGELLALRWSDLVNGGVFIERSLTQTREGLQFKSTKTGKPRRVVLPALEERFADRMRFLLSLTENAKDFVLREGTDPRYGARHLKRAVERSLVAPLCNLLATSQLHKGDQIRADLDKNTQRLLFYKDAENVELPELPVKPLKAPEAEPAEKAPAAPAIAAGFCF